jgi:hypothetical protein
MNYLLIVLTGEEMMRVNERRELSLGTGFLKEELWFVSFYAQYERQSL